VEARSIQFVADACGARLVAGDWGALVQRVTTDSRQARAGDLFVALAGEKFDGHAFVARAVEAGVDGLLVERRKWGDGKIPSGRTAVLAVENTRLALGQLAARYRTGFGLPIVVVGGSNGKTTTKDLVASVLRQRFPTLWSEASFNNDIGVPLTLLRLEAAHQAAVLEVGTNHPGELAPLLDMIQPRLGVITSIGREHLEFFGDLDGVVREEGTIGEQLPADGRLLIPGDSPWAEALAGRARCPVVRVGLTAENDWRARDIQVGEDGAEFDVESPDGRGSGRYRIRLLGRHQVTNALFAVATATELGLEPDFIRQGLWECAPPKMRMQLSTVNGIRVLDDSYNANADSVVAALQTLVALPCSGRRIAVLGDMAELGAQAQAAHEEIGRKSAELQVDCLVAVGRWAAVTASAASRAGLDGVMQFPDVLAASRDLPQLVAPGDTVLLKASRASGLEKVVEAIRRPAETGAAT
jgi:UDP-N-acetylmuramoyl-tripeptide--D-alanyl-D-alanine ligase